MDREEVSGRVPRARYRPGRPPRRVMTLKTCLRCDWHGETKEPKCPNCGVPVYVIGASPSGEAGKPAGSGPEERSHEGASTASMDPGGSPSPRSDLSPSPTFAGTNTSARLAIAAAAVVLVAVVINNLLSASSGIAGVGR